MADENILLKIDNVSKHFRVSGGILKAVNGVSLEIKKGETLGLVGESGCGKSVTAQTIMKLNPMPPARIKYGTLTLGDIDIINTPEEDMQKIRGKEVSMIFQDPMTCLNPTMKVGKQIVEAIVHHQHLSKEEAQKKAIEMLKLVQIPNAEERANQYPHQFSGGMRQRIVIAIALACHPDVLICDEPTTALDVTIQAQIIDLLKSLKEEYGFSVIFITHDLGVVASIADKVAVMYAGEIIEYATVEEIFYEPCHPYTWSLLSSLPQLADDKGELFSIPGTPPSLYTPVVGDAFALRSDYAMQIDFEEKAPQFQVSDTHWAKTWLLHEDAPKVEKPAVIQNLHEKIRANMGFAHLGDEEEGNA